MDGVDRELYWAKSENADGTHETVKSHLQKVSSLANEYAANLNASELAEFCGLLHDVGKYGELFQKVLEGMETHIDHAAPGAAIINLLTNGKPQLKFRSCIEAVNGHHGGLKSYAQIKSVLMEISGDNTSVVNGDKKCSVPNEYKETIKTIFERFVYDFPEFSQNVKGKYQKSSYMSSVQADDNVAYMLLTRMLYSCLVDADYSASASVNDKEYMNTYSGNPLDVDEAEKKLDAYVESIKKASDADSVVNAVRDELYQNCKDGGDSDKWLMTVTAPTGAGKTLALMKLALRKCRKLGLSRIIIVLPFLSVADQTEEEYRKIIPDLIVDHSQSKLKEDQRELAARWDAPCIITTSVKFFESLFSCNGPACRKLHNISNSVVVFDEAQTLPFSVTRSTIESMMALCKYCRTAMVLSTATQPTFEFLNPNWKPDEVVKDVHAMYERMKRVNIEWRIKEETPLVNIADESRDKEQCLVVSNIKSHAVKIFESWGEESGTYLFTTALCPAHRKNILSEIKTRLNEGLPCKVSSTQCIEAGVSIDFPNVYRALAPLTSISQTAGRCNRHGKFKTGEMMVYVPCDEDETGEAKRIYPDNWYHYSAITAKGLMMSHASFVDINDPDIIREYYRRLFATSDFGEDKSLSKAIEQNDYESVEKTYKIISSEGYEVIVPYDDEHGTYEKVKQAFIDGKGIVDKALLTETAGITVSTYARADDLLSVCEPVNIWNPRLKEATFSGKYILRTGEEACYDSKKGLQIEKLSTPGFIGV